MFVTVLADVLAWYFFAYRWDCDSTGGGGLVQFISTPSWMRRPSGSLCLDIRSMVHLVLVSPLCSSAQCFHSALDECLEWSRSQCSWLLVSMLSSSFSTIVGGGGPLLVLGGSLGCLVGSLGGSSSPLLACLAAQEIAYIV